MFQVPRISLKTLSLQNKNFQNKIPVTDPIFCKISYTSAAGNQFEIRSQYVKSEIMPPTHYKSPRNQEIIHEIKYFGNYFVNLLNRLDT